jgi:hypothetical protein
MVSGDFVHRISMMRRSIADSRRAGIVRSVDLLQFVCESTPHVSSVNRKADELYFRTCFRGEIQVVVTPGHPA